jgi:hypothetical protein
MRHRGELANPFSEQSMTITDLPLRLEARVDLYADWPIRSRTL